MRRTATLFVILVTPVLLSCGDGEPACETREAGLAEQRWILECGSGASIPEANPVASYFDPEWMEDLPSSLHVYCSDRGPTVAWNPGVRTADSSSRWRDKAVEHRVDGGRRIQGRWMVKNDAGGRPTYYLYGSRAATFVEALREARELLLETRLEQDEEPTLRLVTLAGLPGVLERIPCLSED
ncbi:MAG: hypothetical protein GTO46_08320 [Gemmatimonadetes bacterium]|nr:hypothetical protein [Gemmatimonadota bacterium]NIO31647.1 hypothetical protein [Gemmatimonadota bacterium]